MKKIDDILPVIHHRELTCPFCKLNNFFENKLLLKPNIVIDVCKLYKSEIH